MARKEIIIPYQSLSGPNTATILIVGDQGTHKHDLAKCIVDLNPVTQVRTVTSLPLPAKNASTRPRIDYVVFIVDLVNRKSLTQVSESLSNIDVQFFLGKCCFVATNADDIGHQSIEVSSMAALANSYKCPLFTADLEDDQSRRVVAGQILRMAAVSAGLNDQTSSFLLTTSQTIFPSLAL